MIVRTSAAQGDPYDARRVTGRWYLCDMPSSRTLHTVRAATSLATARPAYAAGLRAAIVTVIPLVIDAALGTGGGTWMSLGGFNVALSDRGGPYRIRAATMGAVTICCALAIMLGTLASEHV